MISIDDLTDYDIPLEQRVALGLEFAIAALEVKPSFGTYIPNPHSKRPLNTYQLIPRLRATLKEARSSPSEAIPAGGALNSENHERAIAAEAVLVVYEAAKGQSGELTLDPVSVLCDLLTDLMHYASNKGIDMRKAMDLAVTHFEAEVPFGIAAPGQNKA